MRTQEELEADLKVLREIADRKSQPDESLKGILQTINELETELAASATTGIPIDKVKLLASFKTNKDGTATFNKSSSLSLTVKKTTREEYYPTEDELDYINSTKALITWQKENMYVFTMLAADLAVDRQYEHFTPQGLIEAGIALKGKTWLFDPHEWKTSNEIGRIFDTYVENDTLYLKVYILNNAENQKILENIFAGIHTGISIGFTSTFADMLCDSCSASNKTVSIFDENRCPHQPGAKDEYGNITHVSIMGVLDGFEVSQAPVPAQKPASIQTKSLDLDKITEVIQSGEKSMTAQPKLEEKEQVIPLEDGGIDTTSTPEALANLTATEVTADSQKATTLMDVKPIIMEPEEVEEQGPPEAATPIESDGTRGDEAEVREKLVRTQDEAKSEETDVNKELNTDVTIKSESPVNTKDSDGMADKEPKEEDKDEMCMKGADEPDADDAEAKKVKEAEGIEHDPMADKKLPMWTTELKAYVDGHVSELKAKLDELKESAEETKTVVKELHRVTTPKDGSDTEWAIHAAKQAEQAIILDALVEKTMKVLEAISTDSTKEVSPRQNEWASKLAKKLVSGGNN